MRRGGLGYRVVIRLKGRVERERFGSLEEALDAIEARGSELQRSTRSTRVDTKVLGRYEPAQQVSARLELAGRGGIDVRGDGSASAYTGRVRRNAVAQRGAESAYESLRRALSAG